MATWCEYQFLLQQVSQRPRSAYLPWGAGAMPALASVWP